MPPANLLRNLPTSYETRTTTCVVLKLGPSCTQVGAALGWRGARGGWRANRTELLLVCRQYSRNVLLRASRFLCASHCRNTGPRYI